MSSYLFKNSAELLKLCTRHRVPISEIVIRYEIELAGKSREEVVAKMEKTAKVMQEAIRNGVKKPHYSFTKMSGGNAPKIYKTLGKKMLMNRLSLRSMAYATATGETNATMGRIVAFPTAGGSGVVPGAVFSFGEEYKLPQKKIVSGLFTAAGIGLIIAENSTLSAAAGGCQAEVGAATAMAAAAVTEMRGGSPAQALNAAALALKNMLGLACDPLGGLVEVPCIKRNALGTLHAFGASDLSIAGIESFVPFDEVVMAMKNIGQLMATQIKETALGGLAITPTGLKIRQKLGLPIIQSGQKMCHPVSTPTPDDQPRPLK